MSVSGIMTGLLGFSLKKEMLGESLFFRERGLWSYEIYSIASGLSPLTVQNNIAQEFRNKYSGDVNVKVFNQPRDYSFPNDGIRVAKFNVEVEVLSIPNGLSIWSPELASTSGYRGLDEGLFTKSGKFLEDFKESFDFETAENGTRTYNHSISFGLRTGTKSAATAIALHIFARDRDNAFGISTMVGELATVGDSGIYQSYYSETYDVFRNQYSFARKREVLPTGSTTYVFNTVHSFDLKADGLVEVTEKGTVKGKLTFGQSQEGAEALIANAYTRCNSFYAKYDQISSQQGAGVLPANLVNSPLKLLRMHDRPSLSTRYEVFYTNSPFYASNASVVEESMEVDETEVGIVSLKHSYEIGFNKRTSSTTLAALVNSAVDSSPSRISGYFTPTTWPLKQIKRSLSLPNRSPKGARVMIEYNNHPKYFYNINGVGYRVLEHRISKVLPTDIISEYKVINRPSKLSVINYAYQTEKGEVSISIDAGIGRQSNEFAAGFREDVGHYVANLYDFAITNFLNEFIGTLPLSFSYYIKDVKYSYNSESGTIQITVTFTYSIKKYAPEWEVH